MTMEGIHATGGAATAKTTVETVKRAFKYNLFHRLGRFPAVATKNDKYLALAYTVRDQLLHHWVATAENYFKTGSRTVCYLSAEFLLGPQLGNNLVNMGLFEVARQAMRELDLDLDDLLEQEVEPGLGNGGLGRLAACFLDSLATLQIPAIGYGIRYEFGIFEQEIRDGQQCERTDKWLRYGNPWEIARPEISFEVKLGGHTEEYVDGQGRTRVRWIPGRIVKGTTYDTAILGHRVSTANMLRLWKAEAPETFEFEAFNVGDYYGAVDQNVAAENLTKVLYPNDEPIVGKLLRLEQQYFFVSCSLQDMIRIYLQRGVRLERFHEKYAVQLNDTHPSIAIAELMRLLVDEHGMGWDQAWGVVTGAFGYTNHTLLPEALEKWPVGLFGMVLPRHLQIIYEINRRFLDQVRARFPGDEGRVSRLSLIDETGDRYVRMANLACVGSHAINGVARLHSELVKTQLLVDFHAMSPEKFHNVTNGVTPRRFVVLSNPKLSALITRAVGEGWATDLNRLKKLESFVEDPGFRQEWRQVKLENKRCLARHVERTLGLALDPESLFDIQVKRFHEYKRQHLNVLNILTQFIRIKQNPAKPVEPRTYIFGGKAAPGYSMAKRIIRLIHSVGRALNDDPDVRGRLRVVFLPNFNVKNAHRVYPAADLSEQISTAGKEASGTGNMKFSMNGALTIGTLDGANLEIREEVGPENFFLFGLTADQVQELSWQGYQPWRYYQSNPMLKDVIDLIASGALADGDRSVFGPVVDSLMGEDPFMLMADYQSYVDCQDAVSRVWAEPDRWTRMSILNAARMGKFSSDRSIQEYCRDIWKVQPVPFTIDPEASGEWY
ncbi:MAG: glycogen/starch/alpha-glucan phosphorylase [Candidatus Riflebacteria bacterium]|nr:glycogen/starch/alpha-glucan phosphorylase [Candidatus Riflebacteria bacterium]